MAVIKRSTKGAPLTHAEMDGNWDELIALALNAATKSGTTLSDTLTVNTDALVVRPGKNVSIGTTADYIYTVAGRALNISAAAGAVRLALRGATTADYTAIDFGGGAQRNAVIQATDTGNLTFLTNASAGTPSVTERARITGLGNVLVGSTVENTTDGNAKIQTANGIYLGNSANAAAKVLDWYEEGTFTPVAIGTTTAGTGTYTTQLGRYTRIGNRVFYTLTIGWSAHTGAGNLLIGGLPFTSHATGNNAPAGAVLADGLAVGTSKQLSTYVGSNSNQCRVNAIDLAGGALAGIPIDSTVSSMVISGHYEV